MIELLLLVCLYFTMLSAIDIAFRLLNIGTLCLRTGDERDEEI